uniref:Phospholipid/glycerol acyltransferase domain-containing protein n=1 Tax=Acrobeloides nanus TaxID=290746 RepID=A0A914C9M4_9BILA
MITVFNFHLKWRALMDRAISFWMVIPMFYLQFIYGVKIRVTGDPIEADEPAIIIMNHRTRLDWLYFKLALWRVNPWLMTTYRIALKELVKHVPGIGFGMQFMQYIFLKRDMNVDFPRMDKAIEYYSESKQSYQVLMFPEGTDKTSYTTRKSNEYAQRNGLLELKHVLYPRTNGFIHLLNKMKQHNYISYIYDVTVAYPKDVVQNETDLVLKGKVSSTIHYDVKKIPISDLPTSELDLNKWLLDVWFEKEQKLNQYYSELVKNRRRFKPSGKARTWIKDNWFQNFVKIFGFFFWVSVVGIWCYHMTFLIFVRIQFLWLLSNYAYIYIRYGGIDQLIYQRWEQWASRNKVHVI